MHGLMAHLSDVFIVLLIVGIVLWIIRGFLRRRQGLSSGGCAGCSSSASSQGCAGCLHAAQVRAKERTHASLRSSSSHCSACHHR